MIFATRIATKNHFQFASPFQCAATFLKLLLDVLPPYSVSFTVTLFPFHARVSGFSSAFLDSRVYNWLSKDSTKKGKTKQCSRVYIQWLSLKIEGNRTYIYRAGKLLCAFLIHFYRIVDINLPYLIIQITNIFLHFSRVKLCIFLAVISLNISKRFCQVRDRCPKS